MDQHKLSDNCATKTNRKHMKALVCGIINARKTIGAEISRPAAQM